MGSLLPILSTIVLSGSIFSFLPDGPNTVTFSEGGLFLAPLASRYNNGFSVNSYQSKHDIFGDKDLVTFDIAKEFSLSRWYFGRSQIVEVGGVIGMKNYFSYRDLNPTDNKNKEELLLINNDYILGYSVGLLLDSFVLRLNWNYERKEVHREFLDYLPKEPGTEGIDENANNKKLEEIGIETARQARATPLLEGDYLELLFGDIRPSLRYYIAYGNYLQNNLNLDQKFARYGFDYRGAATGNVIRLIFGGEQRAYEYNDWSSTYHIKVGLEKSKSPVTGWRITADWIEGFSDYSPYHSAKSETMGLNFNLIF